MSATTTSTAALPALLPLDERLQLANQLYREFHTRCFWHSPRDLAITEELLPFVAKGLRTHGGRRGFILSRKLLPRKAARKANRGEPCQKQFPPSQGEELFAAPSSPNHLAKATLPAWS
jgi:hypothetical protein